MMLKNQGPLQSCVSYLIESSIAKKLGKGLMISSENEVVTTKNEVFRLFKTPSNSQGFTFYRGISLLGGRQESGSGQCYAPTIKTTI